MIRTILLLPSVLAFLQMAQAHRLAYKPVEFALGESKGFVLEANATGQDEPWVWGQDKPWVWYAPTLPRHPDPSHTWYIDQLLAKGISLAGCDQGEVRGSPKSVEVFTKFYHEMISRGYSKKPVLLGQSRGGLMMLSWAVKNPNRVGGFAGIYPVDTEDYEELRNSMEKLQLNDASLTFEPESSAALGFGFRCGFLGMLHMEIIQERLEREFGMTVITTVPNVSYYAYTKAGEELIINNPSDLPDPSTLDYVKEPYIRAQIITKSDFIGAVMSLCIEKRGELKNQVYLTTDRVELTFEMPLGEIVFDFYDKLKTISRGYASFDYFPLEFRQSNLSKLDILLNGDQVDALSALIHRDNAYTLGKKICLKLKELIPRQQFDIAIQSAIGAKLSQEKQSKHYEKM